MMHASEYDGCFDGLPRKYGGVRPLVQIPSAGVGENAKSGVFVGAMREMACVGRTEIAGVRVPRIEELGRRDGLFETLRALFLLATLRTVKLGTGRRRVALDGSKLAAPNSNDGGLDFILPTPFHPRSRLRWAPSPKALSEQGPSSTPPPLPLHLLSVHLIHSTRITPSSSSLRRSQYSRPTISHSTPVCAILHTSAPHASTPAHHRKTRPRRTSSAAPSLPRTVQHLPPPYHPHERTIRRRGRGSAAAETILGRSLCSAPACEQGAVCSPGYEASVEGKRAC
ncbi:hypothetical protein C8J57DRAFT_1538366 [Mycena rebaudengoi]|nr:hypothetical protein C8J57DRAFT_1538366 [Mycena rebaudengoi]